MHRSWPLLVLAGALLLGGCGDGVDTDTESVPELSTGASTGRGFEANLDLSASPKVLPFPNNLMFSNSLDGTLNLTESTDVADPQVALSALDGFSTVAPISATFGKLSDPLGYQIDRNTLSSSSVRVFEVKLTGIGGAVTEVTRELSVDFLEINREDPAELLATLSSVDSTNRTLVLSPLRPLESRTSYLVALTSGIKSVDGRSAMASDNYLAAKTTPHSLEGTPAGALEPVRRLVQAQEAALAEFGMDPVPVVLSWVFTTQSVGVVLAKARENAGGEAGNFAFRGTTTTYLGAASRGLANVYVGTLEIPYYLTNADVSPLDPLTTFWHGQGGTNLTAVDPDGHMIPGGTATPVATSRETIPLLVTIPGAPAEEPAEGWPVVIYQHGITTNRTTLLAIADKLASEGFAAVAIDLPLHGLPLGHPLGVAGATERTFYLDVVTQNAGGDIIAEEPDTVTDTSGRHFINLESLLTTRDNVRQAVADLFTLTQALETMDYDPAAGDGPDFNMDKIYFVGHSLGGMVGGPFLALEGDVKSAVLGMPGGGIAKLLDGSAAFGKAIADGLAAADPPVLKGTATYESFLLAAQTVIDSADPINYTTGTVAGRGLLLFEVIGDGGDVNLPDQVVPNNVFLNAPAGTVPSPTAGTDPLARFMGLIPVDESTEGTGLKSWVRFTAGHHASLLRAAADPATDPVPTAEETLVQQVMQTAMASFLASDGASLTIIPDSGVVEVQP